jgi:hypothetical protein
MPSIIHFDKLLNRFPSIVNRQRNQRSIDLHGHAFRELVIIISGKGEHFSGKESYPVMTGDCFLVEGAHGYRSLEPLSLVNILFKPSRLPLPWQEFKTASYHAFFGLEENGKNIPLLRLRLAPQELALRAAGSCTGTGTGRAEAGL